MSTLLLGDAPPLVDDLVVVAAQAVYGLYHQHVALAQPPHESLVLRPLEVLAARLVREHLRPLQTEPLERVELPVEVLVPGRNPRVTVRLSRHVASSL